VRILSKMRKSLASSLSKKVVLQSINANLLISYKLVVLPDSEKTSKPISSFKQGEDEVLMGVAGGDKYVVVWTIPLCITRNDL